jgi:hypothetical protein
MNTSERSSSAHQLSFAPEPARARGFRGMSTTATTKPVPIRSLARDARRRCRYSATETLRVEGVARLNTATLEHLAVFIDAWQEFREESIALPEQIHVKTGLGRTTVTVCKQCPACGAWISPRGMRMHQGSRPCMARARRRNLATTHVEVSRWQHGLNPYAEEYRVDWYPGAKNRAGRWIPSYWVEKKRAGWFAAHGLDVLHAQLIQARRGKPSRIRPELRRAVQTAQRFGASACAQLQH